MNPVRAAHLVGEASRDVGEKDEEERDRAFGHHGQTDEKVTGDHPMAPGPPGIERTAGLERLAEAIERCETKQGEKWIGYTVAGKFENLRAGHEHQAGQQPEDFGRDLDPVGPGIPSQVDECPPGAKQNEQRHGKGGGNARDGGRDFAVVEPGSQLDGPDVERRFFPTPLAPDRRENPAIEVVHLARGQENASFRFLIHDLFAETIEKQEAADQDQESRAHEKCRGET